MDKSASIGWEQDVTDGYSDYMLGSETIKDNKDLLKRTYGLCRQRLASLGLSKQVALKVTAKENSTNCMVINIGTDVIDDSKRTPHQKLDVLLGETTHEAAHVLYTDFDILNASVRNKVHKAIINVIEDERIERLIGRDSPGYARNIEAVKSYFFDRINDFANNDEAERFFNAFLRVVRFPTNMDEEILSKYGEWMQEVVEVLMPYPETNEAVIVASDKVYDVLKRFYEEEPDSEKGSDDSDTEGSKEEEEKWEGEGKSGKASETDESGDSESEGMDDKSVSHKKNAEKRPETPKKKEKDFEKDMEEFAKKLVKVLDSSVDHASEKKNETSEVVDSHEMEIREMQDELILDKDNTIFKFAGTGNRSDYEAIKSMITSFVGPLSRKLQLQGLTKTRNLKGLRYGKLDTSRIAEVRQGVDNVYYKRTNEIKEKASVVLVIDESGSMGGKKILTAREVAILFNEALEKVKNLDLYIYGHTADQGVGNETNITIYKEKGFDKREAMSEIYAKLNNRDGIALERVAHRVRSMTSEPAIMFVLSDGQPSARGYSGVSAIQATRQSVKKIERMDFFPIQIGIETHYSRNEMFDEWVQFTDHGVMIQDVGKILSRVMKKLW
jgi:uncharacterized protein YutE (UPF0331/DUF86 family)